MHAYFIGGTRPQGSPSPIAPTRDTRRDASTRHLSLPRISVPLVIIRGSQTLSNNGSCRSPLPFSFARLQDTMLSQAYGLHRGCLANDGGPIREEEEEEEGREYRFAPSFLFSLFVFDATLRVGSPRDE